MPPEFAFTGHLALLNRFLDLRPQIAARIESRLLNVRGKDISRRRDRRHFIQVLDSCFFDDPALARDLSRLKGQLAASHLADGFEPVRTGQFANELDPLELVVRAYEHWEHHRWPGSSGRLTYARSIYAVYLLRQLEYLSLRIWDDGPAHAAGRRDDVQRLLDRLNAATAPDAFVRDVGWLIQTAQGPLTLQLQPYFVVAENISRSLPGGRGVECHKAGAALAGGHLRSQLRYRAWKSRTPVDDPELLAFMRYSNSMDCALLVGDLVRLLETYREARAAGDAHRRLALADAILQGISSDPELYLARLDLLAPSTMIEELFVERGEDSRARYTAMGDAHLQRLARYGELIGELAGPLKDDAPHFAPAPGVYSPYGVAYGFVADVLSNMAIDTLVVQPGLGLSLEDMFDSRSRLENKLARANGWRALPIREGEQEHFDHSFEWADVMFGRLTSALGGRAVQKAGRLLVAPHGTPTPAGVVPVPELCFTSDLQAAGASGATPLPKSEMIAHRREGRFLASVESDGVWFGVSKIILTMFLAQGRDALIAGVPPPVVEVLRLTCPGLVADVR